jgi:peptidoglycan/LPS O-acetylase OafA/YrhL
LGAIGQIKGAFANKLCTFLGDISYPVYIIHYPITYVFYAWVVKNNIPVMQGLAVGIGILLFTLTLSYLLLKYYDQPVRRWLANRLMKKSY